MWSNHFAVIKCFAQPRKHQGETHALWRLFHYSFHWCSVSRFVLETVHWNRPLRLALLLMCAQPEMIKWSECFCYALWSSIYTIKTNPTKLILLHLLVPHHHPLILLLHVIKCPLRNDFSSGCSCLQWPCIHTASNYSLTWSSLFFF